MHVSHSYRLDSGVQEYQCIHRTMSPAMSARASDKYAKSVRGGMQYSLCIKILPASNLKAGMSTTLPP